MTKDYREHFTNQEFDAKVNEKVQNKFFPIEKLEKKIPTIAPVLFLLTKFCSNSKHFRE